MRQSIKTLSTAMLMLVLLASSALAQQTVVGTVLDESNNQPLIGANVVVQGTSIGTSTNLEDRCSSAYDYAPLAREIDV